MVDPLNRPREVGKRVVAIRDEVKYMAGFQLQLPGSAICRPEIVHPAVVVEGPVSTDYLAELSTNGDLANFRSPGRQKTALIEIAGLNPGLVFPNHGGNFR